MRFSGTQTGTRQKAKRPSAGMSHRCQAFNHRPVSADPRHMGITRAAEEVCPFLNPDGSAWAARPCHMARTGAQTPRPSCPEPRRGGCIRGCDSLPLQPSWAFKAKSLKPGFANSSKPTPVPALFSHFGDHPKAPL